MFSTRINGACTVRPMGKPTKSKKEPDTEQLAAAQNAITRAKALGIKQAAIARHLGITEGAVTNWKRRGVSRQQFRALAELLHWTVDELVGRAPPKNGPPPDARFTPFERALILAYRRANAKDRAIVLAALQIGALGLELRTGGQRAPPPDLPFTEPPSE